MSKCFCSKELKVINKPTTYKEDVCIYCDKSCKGGRPIEEIWRNERTGSPAVIRREIDHIEFYVVVEYCIGINSPVGTEVFHTLEDAENFLENSLFGYERKD